MLCWGDNEAGQLGDGTTDSRAAPAPVAGVTDAVWIAVGPSFACAVRRGGSVVCWGSNRHGQLGVGTFLDRPTPAAVEGLSDVVEVGASLEFDATDREGFACARRAGGDVWCWGDNRNLQLGRAFMRFTLP